MRSDGAPKIRLKTQGYNIDRAGEKVAETFEMEPETIWKPGNQPLRVKAIGSQGKEKGHILNI